MTNLARLQAVTEYQLPTAMYQAILADHALSESATYTTDNVATMQLCKADVFEALLAFVDWTDSQVSNRLPDRAVLQKQIDEIRSTYGAKASAVQVTW